MFHSLSTITSLESSGGMSPARMNSTRQSRMRSGASTWVWHVAVQKPQKQQRRSAW